MYDAVVQAFGREILRPDGTINRALLADKAFPDRIRALNAICSSGGGGGENCRLDEMERAHPGGVAVIEAALLIEAGAHKHFDKIIVVVCSFDEKVEHYAHRAAISLEAARYEVERRGAAQFSDERKAEYADCSA